MLTRILLWDDNQSEDVKIDKSDIVLIIGDNIENGVEWLKLVAAKQNNIPETIYSRKAGALKYNPIIFAKYLQYKYNAEDIFFNNKKYTDNDGELFIFFELWESLVCLFTNNRTILVRNMLAKLEVLAKGYRFFCEIGKLLFFLEKYLKIVSDNLLFKYFENYNHTEKAKISSHIKIILQRRLSFVKEVDEKVQKFKHEKFSKAFLNLHSFLRNFNNSNYRNYHYCLSSYMFFLSNLYFLRENYTLCVQLCHRSVDTYLEYLTIKYDIDRNDYMIPKYNKLVDAEKLISNKTVLGKLEYINNCRNSLLLTHGSWGADMEVANEILNTTKEIISSIEGRDSKWRKFCNLIKPLELEKLDIFAFEEPVSDFLNLETMNNVNN